MPLAREPSRRAAAGGWTAAALTIASGVLYGVSFPPLALRPLAWVALVPWLVAIRSGSARRAVLLGVLWAHVETFVTSDCLPGAVVNYYQQSAAIGWLMLEGATLVTMVPWYGAFALAYRILARAHPAFVPLTAAAAWCACELARVEVLGGNPWAISGYSQVGVLPIMQIADLAGVHGISFAIAATNAAVAELWAARDAPGDRRAARRGAMSAAAVVALILLYGSARLAWSGAETTATETKVAIIQGNVDFGAQWRDDLYGRNLDTYLRLTLDAVAQTKAHLVFWPESALTFFLADEPVYRAAMARVLSRIGAQVVTGGPRVERPHDAMEPTYFNATFLLSPGGEIVAWQDKTKLLPFAESFPLQSVALLRREFGRARQFSVGQDRPPLPTVAGAAGVLVCNEGMFGEIASDRVRNGAEILVNPANDSWFGSLKYSLQAFDIVRLRAVEQRRYLVRASTAGPSAIVDPWGRVAVASRPFVREWISGTVRSRRGTTIYQAVGDLFAAACAGVAAVALALSARQPQRPLGTR